MPSNLSVNKETGKKMKRFKTILYIFSLLCFLGMAPFDASAKPKEKESNERSEELDDLDFVEMLNSVETGSTSALIQKFQAKEGKNKLWKKYNNEKEPNLKVEAFRNKEVLLITIPAHMLFAPNDTELKAGSSDLLSPIRRYLKDPDMFRVLLVMHTDNTGSEEYRDKLTLDRVNSVFDWFEDSGVNTNYLFSYALGDSMPLTNNDTMENRDKNRRLEIYLVPGSKMVKQAQKGRIAF